MKKILLVLILGIFCLPANAYIEYSVPDDKNPSFIFDVVAPGEYIESQTSTFLIPYDYILPILDIVWQVKFKISNLRKTIYHPHEY